MDREQEEMQFLGLFGIYKESYKIILTWRKIFSQITFSLILPLSFIFLAHIQVSDLLFSKIINNQVELDYTRDGTARHDKLSNIISTEWAYFWLFKAIYFTFLLIFSLLSTSAVVYTIACVYTGRDVSFKKVMSVVPKVWKRLIVTFLCAFVLIFAYHIIAVFIFIASMLMAPTRGARWFVIIIISGFYIAGLVYLSIIWHLASVVSVLEEAYGIQAMMKSKALIKGKMWVAAIVFFLLSLSLGTLQFAYRVLVVYGGEKIGIRVFYGIICVLVLFKLILFGLVIQTVIYFVCKSYHHENIDKSALSDHLEVYLGEYVPLKAKDVQLEHFEA
ncbi:hypothetical protein HS088_TW04G01052 [Tripterygium wilfordii]|uniref:Polyadenylate-binding protein 1-B-binding protein n=1 Tax=Tripterygium wilfordii TaxID=458696 RepID=A0A7J7DRU3_TRIWF|nr:uncharacterized protein LOC119997164 [Tripterygium wilfordii]KAF5749090.1 hypothetical protein HS088_TW04G01052 [Tripterygium wilfordii]